MQPSRITKPNLNGVLPREEWRVLPLPNGNILIRASVADGYYRWESWSPDKLHARLTILLEEEVKIYGNYAERLRRERVEAA